MHLLWAFCSSMVGQAWQLFLELLSIGIGSADTTSPLECTSWTNLGAEGAPLESCDGAGFKPVLSVFIATCRYSGWEMPLRAEHGSHTEHDLLGEEKCPSGVGNQWGRYSQRKVRLVTFLPFQAYMDPVPFSFLTGKVPASVGIVISSDLVDRISQILEAEHKSGEFCLVFPCHK